MPLTCWDATEKAAVDYKTAVTHSKLKAWYGTKRESGRADLNILEEMIDLGRQRIVTFFRIHFFRSNYI